MNVFALLLSAVMPAEIAVLIVEAALVVGGGVAVVLLQKAINKAKNAASGVPAAETQSENEGTALSEHTAVSSSEQDEKQSCGEENSLSEPSETDPNDEKSVGESDEETTLLSGEGASEDAEKTEPHVSGDEEKTDGAPEKEHYAGRAAAVFAKYEEQSSADETPSSGDERAKAEFEGNVSELQRYIKERRSAIAPDVSGEEEYAAKKQTFDYGAASSGYISPSENSAPQGTFSGYSESDKNALLRHIEDEKKRLSATQMPEHEKVSWDKVKQYNSAILSVGEIDESDDKK